MTRIAHASLARTPASTPLRKWRMRERRPWDWLSVQTGLPKRTLLRVGAGYACNGRVAIAIHEVTGIPAYR